MRIIALVFALSVSTTAFGAGLPPWQFGMTKQQVASFKQFGPYKKFSNGDLETFNGMYRGHKENVQFFFDKDRLQKIGVYLYEGTDRNKTVATAFRAGKNLEKDYGRVELGTVDLAAERKQTSAKVLALEALENVIVLGRSHITPVKQPKNMRVFQSITHGNVQGQQMYTVVVYFQSL